MTATQTRHTAITAILTHLYWHVQPYMACQLKTLLREWSENNLATRLSNLAACGIVEGARIENGTKVWKMTADFRAHLHKHKTNVNEPDALYFAARGYADINGKKWRN